MPIARRLTHLIAAIALFSQVTLAQDATITVQADKPGANINPQMIGVFFEDINFAGDGGLYPERVKNGSFEFEDPMMGWRRNINDRDTNVGGFGLSDDRPLNASNPHFLRVLIERPSQGMLIFNQGFRGIGIAQGEKYTFSVYARSNGVGSVSLAVGLVAGGRIFSEPQEISGFTREWKKYTLTLTSNATEPRTAQLNLNFKGVGGLDIDMVSLLPEKTFKGHGLRTDLAELLHDLKPGFMRFPGGCIVEGRVLAQRYQWKTTIGDITQRKMIINRWNVEFAGERGAPDYYQSFGLGFFEYFQFCEDMGAAPLPILNCGMGCQFNLAELCPLEHLDTYIQDALDLIEFANAPAVTTWGAKRAAMGHPQPFNLTMIGIGNEQWGPQYIERYERFAKVLKEKYPKIQLVSGTGPDPSGQRFDYAWTELRRLNADIVDEHFYRPPAFFYQNVNRYDNYPRTGPKVFAGEYASHVGGPAERARKNNWEAGLSEAAFLTGVERNADVVTLASYAPLFGHVDAWQWRPNLIWFDNLRSFGTPSYYVQKLFSHNLGSKILPIKVEGANERLYGSASIDEAKKQIVLKIVNAQPNARQVKFNLAGAAGIQPSADVQTLGSGDLLTENTLDEPTKLVPVASKIENAAGEFTYQLQPNTLSVIRITTR